MTEQMISLRKVSLKFPLRQKPIGYIKSVLLRKAPPAYIALKDISIDVNKGEVLGIIGRNGSGKSTILRVMTGILPVDSGLVLTRGKQTLLAGLGTGFSSHQTGRENAYIFGSILGKSKTEINEKMEEIISFSELEEFIDQPLRTYSAGMKARLGLAVAGAIAPDILLIDEVLGVGDPKFREKSKKRILGMVEDAGTVVIVSHSFGLMKSICTRIAHIHEGEIVFIGDPELAIKSYYDRED
jgi:ABC-type polysaccharide/polyol phosphate transport system ATPase subunit